MAGALVDQARGIFVTALAPRPPKPAPAPGTDAALTNNVPPSPWVLGLTASAARSLAMNDKIRVEKKFVRPAAGPPRRPGPGPDSDSERAGSAGVGASGEELAAGPPRRPKFPPTRPRPVAGVCGGLALARRRRFVSARRVARGSNRALTS